MKSSNDINIEQLADVIRSDKVANSGNSKGRFLVLFFRVANFIALVKKRSPVAGMVGYPIVFGYKIIVNWILGVEVQVNTTIGKGLAIYHGQGLVVHESACIGRNVVLRHNTTIGRTVNDQGIDAAPQIGDRVDIGCHSVLIGGIKIGENTIIGAGSVVTSDLPPNCVAAGNPAKIIKIQK